MASALKTWRLTRREALYWQRAMARSNTLARGEVVEYIDTAIMYAGRALSQYRRADQETKDDQLYELRMNLEAALGMVDDLIERR